MCVCVTVLRTFNQCVNVQYSIINYGHDVVFPTIRLSTPPWRPVVQLDPGQHTSGGRYPLASSQNPDLPGGQEVSDELDREPDTWAFLLLPLGVTVPPQKPLLKFSTRLTGNSSHRFRFLRHLDLICIYLSGPFPSKSQHNYLQVSAHLVSLHARFLNLTSDRECTVHICPS